MKNKNLIAILDSVNIIDSNFVINEKNIEGLSCDSSTCEDNFMFFALTNGTKDGNDYIKIAVEKGATIIITDKSLVDNCNTILVDNVRKTMSIIANNFYCKPNLNLKLIAVVGTNGKTSIVNIIANILRDANKTVAVVGTLGAQIGKIAINTDMTTPDPIMLNMILAIAVEEGIEFVAIEVSAHAIYYQKTYGIKFDIGILTNVTRDHLDFFKTMENYTATKKSFFVKENCKLALLNADDNLGAELIKENQLCNLSYGIEFPSDIFAIDINYKGKGTEFVVNICDKIVKIQTALAGKFNIYNILASIGCCVVFSIDIDIIYRSLKKMLPIKGRFEIIKNIKTVIVDYAHTPDGLYNLLTSARNICVGKLITVFGCGGNRDKTKRPIMGKIAGELSDFTILTSDNCRFENPMDIISDIVEGISKVSTEYISIKERENAIAYAISLAEENDLVVIAGKGCEEYMDEQGIKTPYSDKNVALDVLRRYDL